MSGYEASGWWACDDGDEFPSREDAIEHLRWIDVNDTGRGRMRQIFWGAWEEVDLTAPSAASGDPVAHETTPPTAELEQGS